MAEQSAETSNRFERVTAGDLPSGLDSAVDSYKKQLAEEKPTWATRKASESVLKAIVPAVPEMIGGSADLTGSNNTRTPEQETVSAENFNGSFVHWGIREHGMAAAMNGMALHGGFIPYSGTFLVFSDYSRPAIRLSALMEQRTIHVMTHDSIGLGEDGPTHQPVEHLAALRAMPNVNVFRPADAIETLECWQLALQAKKTTSILALTRQGLPPYRDYENAIYVQPGLMNWPLPGKTRKSPLWRQARKFSLPCRRSKNCVIWIFRRGLFPCPAWNFCPAKRRSTGRYYRRCAVAYCGRSGGTTKLGPVFAPGRYFHWHGRIWRQCACRPAISAFWHHG